MKRFGLLLIVSLLSGCFSSSSGEDSFELLSGTAFNPTEHEFILLNYWAQWCKPCAEEMPELNAFAEASSVPVLGINFDGLTAPMALPELRQQAEQLQVQFGVLQSESAVQLEQQWQLPRPQGLPATYIVDNRGKLLRTLLGPQTQESLQQVLLELRHEET